jgi:hypothetical protein
MLPLDVKRAVVLVCKRSAVAELEGLCMVQITSGKIISRMKLVRCNYRLSLSEI